MRNAAADPQMTPAALADVITELGSVVAFVRRTWAREMALHAPEIGISDAIILHVLHKSGEITATALRQRLDLDKADVSRRVACLRKLGLVSASPSPEDGRMLLLALTESGQALMQRIRDGIAAAYQDRLAGWESAELEAFARLLVRFNTDAHR